MGGVVQTETVTVAKAAIHFNARDEILRAKAAALRRGFQSEGAAGAERVAEFPGMAAREVLGCESVFGDIPALESLRQEQLDFNLVIVFAPGDGVRDGVVGFDVVT